MPPRSTPFIFLIRGSRCCLTKCPHLQPWKKESFSQQCTHSQSQGVWALLEPDHPISTAPLGLRQRLAGVQCGCLPLCLDPPGCTMFRSRGKSPGGGRAQSSPAPSASATSLKAVTALPRSRRTKFLDSRTQRKPQGGRVT